MTRILNKKIWPYSILIKDDDYIDADKSDERESWLMHNLKEDIRNRVYIIETTKGSIYYFRDEKDYAWFLWRWQ